MERGGVQAAVKRLRPRRKKHHLRRAAATIVAVQVLLPPPLRLAAAAAAPYSRGARAAQQHPLRAPVGQR